MGAIDEFFAELGTVLGPEEASAARERLTLEAMKLVMGGANKARDFGATLDQALGPVAAKAVREAAIKKSAGIATELTSKFGASKEDVERFVGFLRGSMP